MDSDDYTTDDGKRKRDEGEEEKIFKGSKKTARSPFKKSEDKLDRILQVVEGLATEIKQMREIQEKCTDEIKKLTKENKEMKEENERIKKENEEIKKEVQAATKWIEQIEKEKRRNNIVLTGLRIDTNKEDELKEAMANFIKTQLDVEVQIKKAYKLGEKVCLVEMDKREDKSNVMKNKSKLKSCREGKIFINDDLTKKEREVQKKVVKIAQRKKQGGQRVKVGYKKLWIDGIKWEWKDELQDIVEERGAQRGSTKN